MSVELPIVAAPAVAPGERDRLVARARLLARLGLGWHVLEAAIAIGAGMVASSIALVGFGADSLVEAIAGVVVLWRFGGGRADSEAAERRAQRLIALSFYLLAAWVAVFAVRALVAGVHPEVSWVGIGLSIVTLATMPPLAAAKARVGERLGSAATKNEGRQNLLCAWLSAGLLVGLAGNAAFGLWWLDPVVALGIAGAAVYEGRRSWQGQGCECCA